MENNQENNRREYDARLEHINKQLEESRQDTAVRFDHLSNKVELMASSVSELAHAIAKKEISDQYIKEHMADLKSSAKESFDSLGSSIKDLEADVNNIKIAMKGEETKNKVLWAAFFVSMGNAIKMIFDAVTK